MKILTDIGLALTSVSVIHWDYHASFGLVCRHILSKAYVLL